MRTPFALRKLKAEMVMKGLDLGTVSRRAGIPYTTASEILSGARVDPKRLSKLSLAIHRAPDPEEAGV